MTKYNETITSAYVKMQEKAAAKAQEMISEEVEDTSKKFSYKEDLAEAYVRMKNGTSDSSISAEVELVESFEHEIAGELHEGLISSLIKHASAKVTHKISSLKSGIANKVDNMKQKVSDLADKHEQAASHLHVLNKVKGIHKVGNGTDVRNHLANNGIKHTSSHYDPESNTTTHYATHGNTQHAISIHHDTGETTVNSAKNPEKDVITSKVSSDGKE